MFLFLFVVSLGAFSQDLLLPELPEVDSLELNRDNKLLYPQLLSGAFLQDDFIQFQLPEFNFSDGLSGQWSLSNQEFMTNRFEWNGFFPGLFGPASSVFFQSGSVFSSAAYKLNDRFAVGGYSFGAQSVFSAPFPNQGINNFDFRSSTIFMQYNVSKNFKIETRISVTQGPGSGF